MNWPWSQPVVKTVTRAQCPCGCEVVNRVMTAHHVGGDGDAVRATAAGETVRCCRCGTMFTVLRDGGVIIPRQAVPGPTARSNGTTTTTGFGSLDNDLADFEARLPPL